MTATTTPPTATLAKLRKHCEKHGITLDIEDGFTISVQAPPHTTFVGNPICTFSINRRGWKVGEIYAAMLQDTENGVEPCQGDCENNCYGLYTSERPGNV